MNSKDVQDCFERIINVNQRSMELSSIGERSHVPSETAHLGFLLHLGTA